MDLIALQLHAAAVAQRTKTSDDLYSAVPGYVPLTQPQFDKLKTNVFILYTLTRDFKTHYGPQFTPPIASMVEDTVELTRLIVVSLKDYATFYSLSMTPLSPGLF